MAMRRVSEIALGAAFVGRGWEKLRMLRGCVVVGSFSWSIVRVFSEGLVQLGDRCCDYNVEVK